MALITVTQACGHTRRLRASRSTSEAEMEQRITRAERTCCSSCAAAAPQEAAFPSDRDPSSPLEFTETQEGRRALERWARRYDALNGAPEGEEDR